MIRRQRKLHQSLWLLLVPLMGIAIWFGADNRGVQPPVSTAPYVTQEAALP